MGRVYLAVRNDDLAMRVALKTMNYWHPKMLEAFRSECKILSELNHPGIAHLIDAGNFDHGQPWMAMEYVEGQFLDVYLQENEISLEDRLQLFLQICDALSHAHQQMIIHRDIKPRNIMVKKSGQVKLLDFGIASILDPKTKEQQTVTMREERFLTPEYASPEQVNGHRLAAASDVYSLGVVLYLILTGTLPIAFKSKQIADIIRAVNTVPIIRPSKRCNDNSPIKDTSLLRGDLDSIVVMALEREQKDRYTSVQKLADDIRAFLGGRPIMARPATALYVFCKFISRNKWPVGTLVTMVVALIFFSLYATVQQRRITAERDQVIVERTAAESARERAEKEEARANRKTLESNYHLALAFNEKIGVALEHNLSVEAWLGTLAALSLELPVGKDLPELRGRFLDPRMRGIDKHLGSMPVSPTLTAVAGQPDGALLALAGKDGAVRLINSENGFQTDYLTGVQAIRGLTFSPDGQWLAGILAGGKVHLWNLPDKDLQSFAGEGGDVLKTVFSPDNRWLAMLFEQGKIYVHELAGEGLFQFSLPHVQDLCFGPLSDQMYVACEKGIVKLDEITGDQKELLVFEGEGATALVWHHQMGLVSGWADGSLRFHDRVHDGLSPIRKRHGATVLALSAQARGPYLVSRDKYRIMRWQRGKDGTFIQATLEDSANLTSVSLSERVINACRQGKLLRFDLEDFEPRSRPIGHTGNIHGISLSNDGRHLLTAGEDGRLLLWDLESEKAPRSFKAHDQKSNHLLFSPDDHLIASGTEDGQVLLWLKDGPPDQPPQRLLGHSKKVEVLAFSHNARTLASGSHDGTIRLWDLTSKPITSKVLLVGTGYPMDLAISPSGDYLVATMIDGRVLLWTWDEVMKGGTIPHRSLQGHTESVEALGISADGRTFATADSHVVNFWRYKQKGHLEPIQTYRVAEFLRGIGQFDRALKRFIFGDDSGLLKSVHFLEDGKYQIESIEQTNGTTFVDLSNDGSLLANGSSTGLLNFWGLQETHAESAILRGSTNTFIGVALGHNDQTLVASCADESSIILWRSNKSSLFKKHQVLTHPGAKFFGISISSNDRWLASASNNTGLHLWPFAPNKSVTSESFILKHGDQGYYSVAFSPNSSLVAGGSLSGNVHLWRMKNSKTNPVAFPPIVFEGNQSQVTSVTFSPDGLQLASGGVDHTIHLWQVFANSRNQPSLMLEGHSDVVAGLAFSVDGQTLASASNDTTIRLWDVSAGRLKSVLRGHDNRVYGVAFSPDGKYLASTSADRTVRLWEMPTGSPIAVLQGHLGEVNWLPAFATDNSFLATPSDDATVRIWKMDQLLLPPPGTSRQHFYHELFQRSLYYFGMRHDGFNFLSQSRIRLAKEGQPLVPHPWNHLERLRPKTIPLDNWLLKKTKNH